MNFTHLGQSQKCDNIRCLRPWLQLQGVSAIEDRRRGWVPGLLVVAWVKARGQSTEGGRKEGGDSPQGRDGERQGGGTACIKTGAFALGSARTCTAGDALRALPCARTGGLATVPILWCAFWLNCCSCTWATEAPRLQGTEQRMQSTSWAVSLEKSRACTHACTCVCVCAHDHGFQRGEVGSGQTLQAKDQSMPLPPAGTRPFANCALMRLLRILPKKQTCMWSSSIQTAAGCHTMCGMCTRRRSSTVHAYAHARARMRLHSCMESLPPAAP